MLAMTVGTTLSFQSLFNDDHSEITITCPCKYMQLSKIKRKYGKDSGTSPKKLKKYLQKKGYQSLSRMIYDKQ